MTEGPGQGGERRRPTLPVRALLDEPALGVSLTLVAGASGLSRTVDHPRIQKSGLALAGHDHGIAPGRVQILGQTELSYLWKLDPEARRRALAGFFRLSPCCVVLSSPESARSEGGAEGSSAPAAGPALAAMYEFEEPTGEFENLGDLERPDPGAPRPAEGHVPPELPSAAEEAGVPLLLSPARSSVTITALHALLDDRLAPRIRLHGVLVDVFGVGLLLRGASAIGKSECALDLIMRGHRLVADDVVQCDFRPPGIVFGEAAEPLRHLLEVRGLGVLDIQELFGVTSVRERKRIDVVVRLVEWSSDTEYDRLGLEDRQATILGVPIRELTVPVRPGRDMGSILEVAARGELLRQAGHHPGRALVDRLETWAGLRSPGRRGPGRTGPSTGPSEEPEGPGSRGAEPRPPESGLPATRRRS